MCRLFCVLSKNKLNLSYYLLDAKYSILKQAEYEKQEDGWGLVIYNGRNPSFVIKSIKPVYEEKDRLKSIIFDAKLALFFVRKASNPRGIDKKLLMNIEATQPFYFQNISFEHNGSIEIPDEIIQSLNFKHKPLSLNDSEVYFLCFLKFYEEEENVLKALKRTEEFIIKVFNETKSNKEKPYSSLNVIITDGNKVYALNKYLSNYKKSLIDSDRDYYKMCYYTDEEKLIVASEPIEEEGWKDLGNNKFLEGFVKDDKIYYTINEFI